MRGVVLVLIVCAAPLTAAAQTDVKGNLERGKYLAENVAQCIQCHTPRTASGELIRSKLFDGAAIPVGKPNQFSTWAEFAPRIAGLPQYSDAQMTRLLTTGIGRDGKPLRTPMPTFKLHVQDAADIAAYLRSLR